MKHLVSTQNRQGGLRNHGGGTVSLARVSGAALAATAIYLLGVVAWLGWEDALGALIVADPRVGWALAAPDLLFPIGLIAFFIALVRQTRGQGSSTATRLRVATWMAMGGALILLASTVQAYAQGWSIVPEQSRAAFYETHLFWRAVRGLARFVALTCLAAFFVALHRRQQGESGWLHRATTIAGIATVARAGAGLLTAIPMLLVQLRADFDDPAVEEYLGRGFEGLAAVYLEETAFRTWEWGQRIVPTAEAVFAVGLIVFFAVLVRAQRGGASG